MITPEIRKEKARQEWRELGFYYERDDSAKKWIFTADRKGLGMWTRLLREWAQEPLNAEPSENHDHYGPYMYLELLTCAEPSINDHFIGGPIEDLMKFANMIDQKLASSKPSDVFEIGQDFAPTSEFVIEFRVREDGFDPSEPDEMLWATA